MTQGKFLVFEDTPDYPLIARCLTLKEACALAKVEAVKRRNFIDIDYRGSDRFRLRYDMDGKQIEAEGI